MPFGNFKNLTDDDLKAIYAYLRTLKPVKHRVDNTLPATYCKVCKRKHRGGDQISLPAFGFVSVLKTRIPDLWG